jgi:hypothetical protein
MLTSTLRSCPAGPSFLVDIYFPSAFRSTHESTYCACNGRLSRPCHCVNQKMQLLSSPYAHALICFNTSVRVSSRHSESTCQLKVSNGACAAAGRFSIDSVLSVFVPHRVRDNGTAGAISAQLTHRSEGIRLRRLVPRVMSLTTPTSPRRSQLRILINSIPCLALPDIGSEIDLFSASFATKLNV